MSTKIFNGYKLKANSLEEAIEIVKNGRQPVVNDYAKYLSDKKIKAAVRAFVMFHIQQSGLFKDYQLSGDYNFGQEELDMSAISYVDSEKFKKENNYTYNRNGENKKEELNLILFPGKKEIGGENYYLLTLYVPQDLEKSFLKAYPQITEYKYWNSTDKPRSIKNKDWQKRKEDWDTAFEHIPAYDGVALQIVDEENVNYLCDYKKRYAMEQAMVRKLATPEKIQEYQQRFCETILTNYFSSQLEKGKTQLSNILKINENVREKNFTEEEAIKAQYVEENLKLVIPQTINYELLGKRFKEFTVQLEKIQLSANLQSSSSPIPSKKRKL